MPPTIDTEDILGMLKVDTQDSIRIVIDSRTVMVEGMIIIMETTSTIIIIWTEIGLKIGTL